MARSDLRSYKGSEFDIFKASFYDWHEIMQYPVCVLKSHSEDEVVLGSYRDPDVLKKAIMVDMGFDENYFPKQVLSNAKALKKQYEKLVTKKSL